MSVMKKKHNATKRAKHSLFTNLIIDESNILLENLQEARKWIALTKSGAPLMRKSLDDFYQACLYFIAKAYGKAAGCIKDDRVSRNELSNTLSRSSEDEIIRRLLAEGFIVYTGDEKYVVNYLRMKELFEAVNEAATYGESLT